jgi:hypothetical protein
MFLLRLKEAYLCPLLTSSALDVATTKDKANPLLYLPPNKKKKAVLEIAGRWKRRGKPLSYKPQDYIRDY